MPKRHRRSIMMEDDNNVNDENKHTKGTFYPKLFDENDDGEEDGNGKQQIGWNFRLNQSCPIPDTATYRFKN